MSPMEMGSPDQSLSPIFPSWVIVDQDICLKTPASFRPGDPTSAETRDSNGEEVRVSFTLRALPCASRLCVHFPEGSKKLFCCDSVVAAHGNALLFSLLIDFAGLPSSVSAVDHFIYWASGPDDGPCWISLLPRWYSTMEEIEAVPVGSWRKNPRMVLGLRGTGLLLCDDGEGFVVAELHVDFDGLEDVDAPLEAQLLRLCSSNGAGEWEVKHARARGGKAKFGDLRCWWEATMVIPYGTYLCWVDYSRGIIFCDVNHPSPELLYVSLPVDHIPIDPDPFTRGWPQASRAVCVTKNETLKFVNIARSDGMVSGDSEPGCSFTIIVSTLHDNYDEMWWVTDTTIQAANLWDMEGYDDQLPRVVPQFPLVSMDDPNIIYFVLKERRTASNRPKAWVVALNIDSSKVLWYKDFNAIPSGEDTEMAPGNIYCNLPFFPTEFTKHLQKAAIS